MAPARTPAAAVLRPEETARAALDLPAVRQRIAALGADSGGGIQADFATFLRADVAKWREVVRDAGVCAE